MSISPLGRIIFFGDIFGKPGRNYLMRQLPAIKERFHPDLIIANGENAASDKGTGITASIAHELYAAGVQAITLGNHVWGQKEFVEEIDSVPFVCRPANFVASTPGASWIDIPFHGKHIGIACLIGREFMKMLVESPFQAVDTLMAQHPEVDAWIFDMHAEATAEKVALGWFLNGKALAVLGTHTHIQTNDAAVLDGGTAYMTDVGMCGPFRSVIGHKIECILQRFQTNIPQRAEVATEDVRLCGCIIDVDLETLKAKSIQAFQWPLAVEPSPQS
ncbi:MAG: TIGR00282 family metallophosphoesterase [Puniceicoccales bacterium]|jgi:metallophosphoesterase (TIGR00282 family)|nr:TIGR00282 family metallophosphoesterase [Puniceicoccales bacterium]